MAEIDNIVLEQLRHIRIAMDDVRDDIREIKQSLGVLEHTYTGLSARMDRMDMRIERIERRLDLVEVGSNSSCIGITNFT